ncbi:hypothetical protein Barb6_02545 [Bacteroidales bacterium Barb6]|nr:hypothetical protein Barb6_02545 [Bacteroidales bacterium Barb6]
MEWGAFNNSDGTPDSKLKTVNFNGAVEKIGREAFSYTLIESIDLTGVKEVKSGAFNRSNLQGVLTIPASMTNISGAAFRSLKGVVFDYVIIEGQQTAIDTSVMGSSAFNRFRETLGTFGDPGNNWGKIRNWKIPLASARLKQHIVKSKMRTKYMYRVITNDIIRRLSSLF